MICKTCGANFSPDLLDYFAGLVLSGILANEPEYDGPSVAIECYDTAADMIAEKHRRESATPGNTRGSPVNIPPDDRDQT